MCYFGDCLAVACFSSHACDCRLSGPGQQFAHPQLRNFRTLVGSLVARAMWSLSSRKDYTTEATQVQSPNDVCGMPFGMCSDACFFLRRYHKFAGMFQPCGFQCMELTPQA